ncbi:MAG: AMP-binding protein [Acidobacteria bacterium]|nr:AMP-binding protein [Acidobacteriota bacterium]
MDAGLLESLGIGHADAQRIASQLDALKKEGLAGWRKWCDQANPHWPIAVHRSVHRYFFFSLPSNQGPTPVWLAPEAGSSRLDQFMQSAGFEDYAEFHRWSVSQPLAFWHQAIERVGIRFQRPAQAVCQQPLDVTRPNWLPGALLNIAESCFTAEPNAIAIRTASEHNPTISEITYAELFEQTQQVAAGLRRLGFGPGDRIAIDMPMHAWSVPIYLGIVWVGAVVVSIADSFSPDEIAVRLRISEAKAIFTQGSILRGDKQLPLYEKVVAANAPLAIVMDPPQTLRASDTAWSNFLAKGEAESAVARGPEDLVNILFSSGTTGDPKAIPWTHTTPIKCAVDGAFHQDIGPNDIVAWPTNLGWMMGPWLLFATLINRGTLALFDGAPHGVGFLDFVERAKVTVLGLVPSLLRAWLNQTHWSEVNWTSIKCFSSTGECSNAEDMFALMVKGGYKPVIEYCGGTEIGGAYITGTRVQNAAPSTFSTPALGLNFFLLDEQHQPSSSGEVFLVPPSIGLSNSLLNRDHFETYFQDVPHGPNGEILRRHGDELAGLGGGYFRALGRADDTMNLGGIKVSSAELERAMSSVPGILEVVAVAENPPGGGPSLLVVFVRPDQTRNPNLKADCQKAIRDKLNPLFRIHRLIEVESIPRTASGKIMRRILRDHIKTS